MEIRRWKVDVCITHGREREKMTNWQDLTEEDAIEAAVAEHGKDPTASVAYCALGAYDGNSDGEEYRFWFRLFLKLAKGKRVGWA